MRFWQKMFGLPVMAVAVLAVVSAAFAADSGRSARSGGRINRAGAAARMPVMPTLPINTVGNMTTNLPTVNPVVSVTPTPEPTPDPDPTPDPEPAPECPDGGVRNSEYTVEKCMNDIYMCVNSSLANGINDLFDEEVRNSIINGMAVCSFQVEKCVKEVRRDCENIYHSSADVWIDFNTRKVQPDYYNFVLRKTGLTPRQAENTCWLLDKNTYGASFNAVANSGVTTHEYNNRVGAYNGQGGVNITKKNPQGAKVNDGNPGVDGSRGHYARWDAVNAECHLRVAAYNKDTPIKNSWLFGAFGDDRLAEVWQPAGSSFTCNKDLFGFSLYKNTNTVAVVGIGGGTLLGAGVGALAGHGDRDFDCSIKAHRDNLFKKVKGKITILNEYLDVEISPSATELAEDECMAIVELHDKWEALSSAAGACKNTNKKVATKINANVSFECVVHEADGKDVPYVGVKIRDLTPDDMLECYQSMRYEGLTKEEIKEACYPDDTPVDPGTCAEGLNAFLLQHGQGIAIEQLQQLGFTVETDGQVIEQRCSFKAINHAVLWGDGIYCGGQCSGNVCPNDCVDASTMMQELNRIDFIGSKLKLEGDKGNRTKTTLTGAAIGAGTGGVATAITAFVEKNNINCRVGDGLERVGYGKSMTIGTLRDFYVKWNLRLPETVTPTAMVVDCNSWRRACAEITDLDQCKAVQINYKPANAPAITLIHSACIPSGSVCIENYPVAKSYGACVPTDASSGADVTNNK